MACPGHVLVRLMLVKYGKDVFLPVLVMSSFVPSFSSCFSHVHISVGSIPSFPNHVLWWPFLWIIGIGGCTSRSLRFNFHNNKDPARSNTFLPPSSRPHPFHKSSWWCFIKEHVCRCMRIKHAYALHTRLVHHLLRMADQQSKNRSMFSVGRAGYRVVPSS